MALPALEAPVDGDHVVPALGVLSVGLPRRARTWLEFPEEFVGMYVNNRTLDYGEDGREAIRLFLKRGQEIGMVREDLDVDSIVFVGSGE